MLTPDERQKFKRWVVQEKVAVETIIAEFKSASMTMPFNEQCKMTNEILAFEIVLKRLKSVHELVNDK